MRLPSSASEYAPPGAGWDEMVDAAGQPRAHWAPVVDQLLSMDRGQLARHRHRIDRLQAGHGTTYQLNAEAPSSWTLDPVPVVVTATDWDRLRAGIDQRARLLDAVLADLYGSRRLLGDGTLPPAVILRSADHLPAAVGVAPVGGTHLVFHAADVVRGPDGGFHVLADRCDAPSGAGFALENRELLARVAPQAMRLSGVRRLAEWFGTVHETLASLAPPGVSDPRIVVFTSGPEVRTFFEHGFLAQRLGYSLVQAGDLTVRGGRVWIKGIGGLEPVHVLLRRVWGRLSDPLELTASSATGLGGLLESARRGNVAIANPLGSGAAGNPGLLPFLSGLCRRLLGEEPLLHAVPTYWCGERRERDHVLTHLDRMVIKPINDRQQGSSRFGRLLSTAEREALVRRIEADPEVWVAQDEMELPTSPGIRLDDAGAEVVAQYTLQRTFAVRSGDRYAVMNGALTRSGPRPDNITIFAGGDSKDTWISDPAAVANAAPMVLPALPQVDLRSSLTGRVAETMFWVGRNLERTEAVIRLVHAVNRFLDQSPELVLEDGGAWSHRVTDLIDGITGPPVPARPPVAGKLRTRLHDAVVDLHRPRSLATSLRYLLQGTATVRELFSTDSWRLLTDVRDLSRDLAETEEAALTDLTTRLLMPIAGLSGLFTESMVRDPGWLFLDIGRRLERAQLVASLLRNGMVEPVGLWAEGPLAELVLASGESLVAYKRRHRSDVALPELVALLATDRSNPRSIGYSVDRLANGIADLPAPGGGDVELLVARAMSVAGRLDVGLPELRDPRPAGGGLPPRRTSLEEALADVTDALDALADDLSQAYFSIVSTKLVIGGAERGVTNRGVPAIQGVA